MNYILLIGPISFVIVVLILEKITPGYNWKKDYISELSLTKYGWMQKISFVFCGLCVTGLCWQLANIAPNSFVQIGWYLGSALGIVTLLAGVWDTDQKMPTRTLAGKLHDWTYQIGMLGIGSAYFLIGWGYQKQIAIMIICWAVAIFSWVWWKYGYKVGIPTGIAQRVVIYSALLWLVFMTVFTSSMT